MTTGKGGNTGAAVGLNAAGDARPLTIGDLFVGFAQNEADNTSGAAAAIDVQVRHRGVVELTVAGATKDDAGAAVYAEDDGTFVLTSTGTQIGRIRSVFASGTAEVELRYLPRGLAVGIVLALAGAVGVAAQVGSRGSRSYRDTAARLKPRS